MAAITTLSFMVPKSFEEVFGAAAPGFRIKSGSPGQV